MPTKPTEVIPSDRAALTEIGRSNLYTMSCAAKHDERQTIPPRATLPTAEVAELRMKLLFEEVFELSEALGVRVQFNGVDLTYDHLDIVGADDADTPDRNDPKYNEYLQDVIDGACDVIYVATGTLIACGVCDQPHLREVCNQNNAKFPNGEARVNDHGKFLKPKGWKEPNHLKYLRAEMPNLAKAAPIFAAGCQAPEPDYLYPGVQSNDVEWEEPEDGKHG